MTLPRAGVVLLLRLSYFDAMTSFIHSGTPFRANRLQRGPHVCSVSYRPPFPLLRRRTLTNSALPVKDCRGPQTPPPDYTSIDKNPFNAFFTRIFVAKLEAELGQKMKGATGYDAVIQAVRRLGERHKGDPKALRAASQRVLTSFFPNWFLRAYVVLLANPFPGFASWINAAMTVAVTQWLMGPSKLADDDNKTVEIERCRYLEGEYFFIQLSI